VDFTLADVRSFSLNRKFDAAYSIFESLNHVADLEGLHSAFARVREHLHPGAFFLFDLNREDTFVAQWNETNAIVEDDNVCVLRSHYNQEKRVGVCQVTVFDSVDQEWKRSDFTLRQTCHDIDAVHGTLSSAGFGSIALYDGADLGMNEQTGYARTFFLATAS
jgi:hypothetical protein